MRGLLALVFFIQGISAQSTYDLIIRNAHILDGGGNAWFQGDVAVRGDRIAAVGYLPNATAAWTLDAKGLTLAPGFIDTHSHGIAGIQATPAAENLIRQGVTTIIEGPDGRSPLPIGPFLDTLAQRRIGVNFGLFAGHNSIRQKVMGTENRRATPVELEGMKTLARQAMLDGAFGLSTGLFYVPGNYAPTEEVIEIAKVIGSLGGIHTSHMRSEADQVVESVKETIRIGEEGHLPTQVTHHKIIGVSNWGKSTETLRLIHEARARGVDATLDAYPYTASSTGLGAALVPQWARAGGSKALQERATSPETGRKLRAEMRSALNDTRGGPAKLTLASCGFDRALAGKSLAQAAGDRDPVDVALDFVLRGDCSVVSHSISEEDIERILHDPLTMIASDGGIPSFGDDVPHPRNYATFARVLARYVRERHVLTLEDAVRKMTGLPAQRLGLADRGLIRPGMKADLVLFDPAAVAENSTFEKPHQYASGVTHVWVNGVCALKDGKMTGALGGRALYGPARATAEGGNAVITAAQEREFYDSQYRQFLALPDHALRLDKAVLEGNLSDPANPFYERRLLYRASMRALESEPLPGKRVLDYGCGPADFGIWMATEGAEVTLLDLSPLAIELGLKRAKASGVTRRVKGVAADASKLDMFADAAFDLVFACASLHHTLKYPGAMEELARVMRPGARLVLCETWGGSPLLNSARKLRASAQGEQEEQGEDIILSKVELTLLAAHFSDIHVEHLNLLAMAKRLFRGRMSSAAARAVLHGLEGIDRALLGAIPALGNWCGEAVITARR